MSDAPLGSEPAEAPAPEQELARLRAQSDAPPRVEESVGWFVGRVGRFHAVDNDGTTREVGPQEALNQLWSAVGPPPKGQPV